VISSVQNVDAAVKSNTLFLETKSPFLKFLGRTLNEVSETKSAQRKSEEEGMNKGNISGSDIQGNFVVKLPYAGELPQIYPVGESFSIPFQLWNYESDKKL